MDHGFLLTLSIHLAEIPKKNSEKTLGLKWTHKLRLRLKPKTRKYMQSWEHLKLKSWALTFEVDFNFDEMSKSAGLENYISTLDCAILSLQPILQSQRVNVNFISIMTIMGKLQHS